MTRFLCLLWLAVLLPMAAQAQAVQVTSGEHDGFTRLVLDYAIGRRSYRSVRNRVIAGAPVAAMQLAWRALAAGS